MKRVKYGLNLPKNIESQKKDLKQELNGKRNINLQEEKENMIKYIKLNIFQILKIKKNILNGVEYIIIIDTKLIYTIG